MCWTSQSDNCRPGEDGGVGPGAEDHHGEEGGVRGTCSLQCNQTDQWNLPKGRNQHRAVGGWRKPLPVHD